ncbi:uncharacterized protein LOC144663725 [Oculina patagonica]
MRICYLYAFCFLVGTFIILSYYFMSKKYSVKMRSGVQAVLEENQIIKFTSRLNDIRLDGDLMSRAVQAGNPTRLKNVLKKALRGEDINLLVIGGSHSAGGKLGLDENSLDGLYFKVFAKWWNSTFGKVTKSFMREIKLAIGGTGSPFFAFCYKTFIAEGETIDIFLIEVSANDGKTAKPLEQLTRQVLKYPSAPAVLYINVVSDLGFDPNTGKIKNPLCINLETFGQTEVARHYEITSFSLKEIFCRKESGKWKVVFTNMTASDGNHIGAKAHALVASLMTEYVRSVLKEVVDDFTKVSLYGDDQVGANESSNLPNLLFIKRETEALKDPLCWTGKTPNVFKNLHRPNLQLKVINNSSFSPCFKLYGQNINVKSIGKELRTDSQGGWCAWKRWSTLKLRIYVPKDKFLRSRSVTVLTRHKYDGGQASIWLDNKKQKAIETNSNWLTDRFDTIATRVDPGYHTVTVKTTRGGMFMVAGVFVGAPDFQVSFAGVTLQKT